MHHLASNEWGQPITEPSGGRLKISASQVAVNGGPPTVVLALLKDDAATAARTTKPSTTKNDVTVNRSVVIAILIWIVWWLC